MKPFDTSATSRTKLRATLAPYLSSKRDIVVLDEGDLGIAGQDGDYGSSAAMPRSRLVPTWLVKSIDEWAAEAWPMSLEDYVSGLLYGKQWDGETPLFDLIPESPMSAPAQLGLGDFTREVKP